MLATWVRVSVFYDSYFLFCFVFRFLQEFLSKRTMFLSLTLRSRVFVLLITNWLLLLPSFVYVSLLVFVLLLLQRLLICFYSINTSLILTSCSYFRPRVSITAKLYTFLPRFLVLSILPRLALFILVCGLHWLQILLSCLLIVPLLVQTFS